MVSKTCVSSGCALTFSICATLPLYLRNHSGVSRTSCAPVILPPSRFAFACRLAAAIVRIRSIHVVSPCVVWGAAYQRDPVPSGPAFLMPPQYGLAAHGGIVAALRGAWRHSGGIAGGMAALAAWRHCGGTAGGTWRHSGGIVAAWRHLAAWRHCWRHCGGTWRHWRHSGGMAA